jgi:uncharacterized protein YggE
MKSGCSNFANQGLIMRLTLLLGWIVIGLVTFAAVRTEAQAPEIPGAVTGMGVASLKRAPDLIRVQVQISGDGKTLKEALAKLGARREACKKKLVALGVKEDAITFDDPKVDATDPRQQMEQMMRMQMNRGGRRAAPATSPAAGAAHVAVGAIVKAEWALSAKGGEGLLIAAQDLQDRVKAADLADTKTSSLEEQEAREERAGLDENEQAPPPGQPVFLYVAKVSDEQRAKVLADAFKKAKANAADLAKAAGAELGALKQLQSQATPDAEQYQMMQYARYNPYLYAQAQNSDSTDEAVSPVAGPVTLRLTVSASFAIK